jgi:mitochondrial fission protein ELM1
MVEATSRLIWVLADDRAGNESQCMGVAEVYGQPHEIKRLSYGRLARLPNPLLGKAFLGLTPQSRRLLTPPWPDIVIAAGRRTAPVARKIKKLGGGTPFLLQVMDPGPGGRNEFDLIAVPRHDGHGLAGQNILPIIAAPHHITQGRLADAAAAWQDRFAAYPRPWIGLMVGGSTAQHTFSQAMARDLGARAAAAAKAAGGSLLITTSRRTGLAEAALLGAIDCPAFVYRWSDGGDNPYLAILGLADGLVVTGESVSMCSEAAASSAPVFVEAPPGLISDKHARFLENLYAGGHARAFDGRFEPWDHPTLDVAGTIAEALRQRIDAAAPRSQA